MKTLAIDIETYSSVDLAKAGVYKYAESPDFEILLIAYRFNEEPIELMDLTAQEPITGKEAAFWAALTDPEILKTAFNANFERTCLAAWTNTPMPPEQWSCTAVMARQLGLPASLEAVGAALGLPEDKQKLKTGKALIRYFCKPCPPTKTNGGRTRNLPKHDTAKWELFKTYCRQDVEAEQAIRDKLLPAAAVLIPEQEQRVWCIDQAINDRGVGLDVDLAQAAVEIDAATKDLLRTELTRITGLTNPNSNVQLKGWIEETAGLEVESLAKDKIPDVKEQAAHDGVTRALELRAGLAKSSVSKYDAMLRTVCRDHRIRGLTQYYGASRSGRWAGRLVQLQNLPKNRMDDVLLDIARETVKEKDIAGLELLYANTPDTLSQLIRTAFIPAPGCTFYVSDFSAIEARVLAWIAGEKWRLDVFNSDGKIYERSAERMLHLPEGTVKKGDPRRQKGKIAELALGYGGSVGALKAMGALNMGIAEDELQGIVDSWRAANPAITAFWWSIHRAVMEAIEDRQTSRVRRIGIAPYGNNIIIRLPSGRALVYQQMRLVNEGRSEKIIYMGTNQTTGAWGPIDTYGPKLVENIIQGIARDCLAETMIRLEAAHLPIVFHVHDEVIVETLTDFTSPEEIAEIMGQPISWAPGLPLKADAYSCEYYRKE